MMNDDPSNNLKLSGKNFTNLMRAVLEKNVDFRFQAKGHSMSPFIKNMDIVTVSPLFLNKPEPGDIVAAFFQERESTLVHRVIGKQQGKFIIKGDNNKSRDGVFEQDQIIGVVSKVERNGKRVLYGGGLFGKIIALLSKSSFLNNLILPILRSAKAKIKNLFL
ncbi:MAG: S24/S26 family peptidase [Desulfobacteraceae bacterium]|nr:S24/S26 family peptidase [Desulfobacteraceae bacterium]